jgi:hypothetical protein
MLLEAARRHPHMVEFAAVIAVNLAARLSWVAFSHPAPTSDFAFYYSAAARIADGQGYTLNGDPTAYWPLGWPLVLAGVFWLFGPSLSIAIATQVIATTAIGVFVMLIGWRATGSSRIGLIGALVWTALPDQLVWTSILGSEPIFTLLLTGSIAILLSSATFKRLALGAVIMGFACWVRPTVLLFPFAYSLARWMHSGRLGESAVRGVGMMGVLVLTIMPLTARNYVALGSPVLVSTNGGVNLWQGVHTDTGYWWPTDPTVNPLVEIDDEVARDHLGQRLFLDYAVHNPGDVLRHGVAKVAALYGPTESAWIWHADAFTPETRGIAEGIGTVSYFLFLLLAVLGMALNWRNRSWPVILLVIFVFYYSAVFAVFPAWDRFHYPVMPILAVFVGTAVYSMSQFAIDLFRRTRTKEREPWLIQQ